MINWKHVRYIRPYEVADPLYPGSEDLLDGVLLMMIDDLRHRTGWPLIPHGPVGGVVDVAGKHGHAPHSYHLKKKGCKAMDFHFETDADPRLQYYEVAKSGFPGLGVYYDWHWDGKILPIGFHVDRRPRNRTQRWKRENGKYIYILR